MHVAYWLKIGTNFYPIYRRKASIYVGYTQGIMDARGDGKKKSQFNTSSQSYTHYCEIATRETKQAWKTAVVC